MQRDRTQTEVHAAWRPDTSTGSSVPSNIPSITPERPLHSRPLHHASAENGHCLSTAFRKTKNPSAGLTRTYPSGLWPTTWLSLLPHQAPPAATLSWYSGADTALTLAPELLPVLKALSFSPSIASSVSQIASVQIQLKHLQLPRPRGRTLEPDLRPLFGAPF